MRKASQGQVFLQDQRLDSYPVQALARRRALLRYAAQVHARRGTVPGMLLAATLAWEPDEVDAEPWLAAPESLPERVHGVRLQELFGLAPQLASSAWRPAQGRAALLARRAHRSRSVCPIIPRARRQTFVVMGFAHHTRHVTTETRSRVMAAVQPARSRRSS